MATEPQATLDLPLQLSHMQNYYSKLVYFHCVSLLVSQEESQHSCSCAVSAQFKINCDSPELGFMLLSGHEQHWPAADMVIYLDPRVWTYLDIFSPRHYVLAFA